MFSFSLFFFPVSYPSPHPLPLFCVSLSLCPWSTHSHCINQILESVSHIHQHDIVHRDLKVSHCIAMATCHLGRDGSVIEVPLSVAARCVTNLKCLIYTHTTKQAHTHTHIEA